MCLMQSIMSLGIICHVARYERQLIYGRRRNDAHGDMITSLIYVRRVIRTYFIHFGQLNCIVDLSYSFEAKVAVIRSNRSIDEISFIESCSSIFIKVDRFCGDFIREISQVDKKQQ